jgi:plastocyanin
LPSESPTVSPAAPADSLQPSTSQPPSTEAVDITIGTDADAALTFDPGKVTVPAGAKVQVTFENRATLPHNLTFNAPINVATSAVVAPGTTETIEFTAPAAGDYGFVCTIHPGMGGTLTVEAR